MKMQKKLDASQNAIVRSTMRKLGKRISDFATAFIERYGEAFDLRTFLQTARTPLLVSLPVNRQQIFESGTSSYLNATWTHTNQKDRYRIVLMTALHIDAEGSEIPQAVLEDLNVRANLNITRRARIQVESMRRFLLGHAPAAQGALAAGAAGFSALEQHLLDAELLHTGIEERIENPFDVLQPDEDFSMNFQNLTGQDTFGAFDADIYGTLHGVAMDIITG